MLGLMLAGASFFVAFASCAAAIEATRPANRLAPGTAPHCSAHDRAGQARAASATRQPRFTGWVVTATQGTVEADFCLWPF